MPLRKVITDRFVWQVVEADRSVTTWLARRDDIVDLPAEVATRGDALGALVADAGPATGTVETLLAAPDRVDVILAGASTDSDTFAEVDARLDADDIDIAALDTRVDTLEGRSFKTKRVAVTVAATATEVETITWDTPFADANYTVNVSLRSADGADNSALRIRRVRTITATAVTVIVENADALAQRGGDLHAIAVHD